MSQLFSGLKGLFLELKFGIFLTSISSITTISYKKKELGENINYYEGQNEKILSLVFKIVG